MENEESNLFFKLTVKTGDKASENYILDGQYNRIAKSVGNESTFNLSKGLYSVKVKVGSEFLEKPVTLNKDQTISFDPIAFNSPVPLANTSETSSFQIQTATDYSKKQNADVILGSGGKIFLYGNIAAGKQSSDLPDANKDPSTGLKLRNCKDVVLVDFGRPDVGTYNWEGEPWAACDVDIDPGVYTLSVETALGDVLRLTIVVCPGWQTQVFMQPKNYGLKEKDVRADLAASSIFMARIGVGFNPANILNQPIDSDFRLTEQIRQALSNKRNVIGKGVLESLFSEKFDNPMLGIYAAHLLLLNKDFTFSEIKTLVENLRSLLGNMHPDVEAIALKMGMGSNYVFNTFPMLANSWNFVLEEASKTSGLVPKDSMAYNFSGQFWNCDLWVIWGRVNKNESDSVLPVLKGIVQSLLPENLSENFSDRIFSIFMKIFPAAFLNLFPFYKTTLALLLNFLNPDKRLELSLALGMPRSKIEEILKNINFRELIEAEKKLNAPLSSVVNNDPQKNQWGGRSEVDFRKISATFDKSTLPGIYKVVITVESTDVNFPLSGEVKFHLHNTFLNPDPIIVVNEGKAILKLTGVWGSFTVGAEADDGKTRLELDLAELKGVPQEFKDK